MDEKKIINSGEQSADKISNFNFNFNEMDSGTLVVILLIIAVVAIFLFYLKNHSPKEISKSENINEEIENDNEITNIQKNTMVLFIDDVRFKKIDNLKKNGWHVEYLQDLDNERNQLVQDANIIFVDHKGVGKNFGGNGDNIISALVEKYGKTKWIVLYSGNNYDLNLTRNTKANSIIGKSATLYDFEQEIIHGVEKINDII